jgi:otoferlin
MNARDLIYSTEDEETGVHCGKMQTVFFKLPGKQAAGPAGWKIRAKLTIYAWLGMVKHKKFFFSGLPRGFELSQDLRNAERPRALAPTNIHYLEKHVSKFRWKKRSRKFFKRRGEGKIFKACFREKICDENKD